MKEKWEPKEVIHEVVILSKKEFKQLLEELSQLVYREICQLQKDESSCLVLEENLERTGTDA